MCFISSIKNVDCCMNQDRASYLSIEQNNGAPSLEYRLDRSILFALLVYSIRVVCRLECQVQLKLFVGKHMGQNSTI